MDYNILDVLPSPLADSCYVHTDVQAETAQCSCRVYVNNHRAFRNSNLTINTQASQMYVDLSGFFKTQAESGVSNVSSSFSVSINSHSP